MTIQYQSLFLNMNQHLQPMLKILTSILLLTLVACSQQTGSDEKLKFQNWETFDHEKYSVKYPPEWELDESGKMGTSFILFSPVESTSDKFRANVNLLIQDIPDSINLDVYTEISLEQINVQLPNAHIIENIRINSDADEQHMLIYSGDQNGFQLQFEQYFWVINTKAYVLTFTCEKNKFEEFRETGEGILNSFKLKL